MATSDFSTKRECFARLGLCRPGHVFGRDAWLARQALDTALGFDDLRAESRSFYTTRQRLRVLFTIRRSSHGRDIANIPELLAACPSFLHRGWSIHCNAVPFATLSLRETIARVRAVDMLVCMNGGDCGLGGLVTTPGGFDGGADGGGDGGESGHHVQSLQRSSPQ